MILCRPFYGEAGRAWNAKFREIANENAEKLFPEILFDDERDDEWDDEGDDEVAVSAVHEVRLSVLADGYRSDPRLLESCFRFNRQLVPCGGLDWV